MCAPHGTSIPDDGMEGQCCMVLWYLSQAISTRKWREIICMGAQTRTDVLPYISLIPVFGYLWPRTSIQDGISCF